MLQINFYRKMSKCCKFLQKNEQMLQISTENLPIIKGAHSVDVITIMMHSKAIQFVSPLDGKFVDKVST